MKLTRLLLILTLSATPAFAQLGPCATPIGPLLPNIVSFANVSKQSQFISTETFAADSCSVSDGEVTPGTHTLLRFTSQTGNIGQADINIGNPANCTSLFEFSACHNHYHIHGYTAYRLWTETGYSNWVANRDLSQPITGTNNETLLTLAQLSGDLIVSHKQGFCLIDTERLSGTPAYTRNEYGVRVSTSHYDRCYDNQGLSIGYGDSYGALLDGQYLVIDGLLPGWYMLEIQANPEQVLPESSYTDNSSAARIRI